MFKVVEPLITSNKKKTTQSVYMLDEGVKLSNANITIRDSILQNLDKKKYHRVYAKRHMKF